jgi:DNA-binding NtrC family response regulator
MDTTLSGRTILVVEDERSSPFDIVNSFERAGAAVALARSLTDARTVVEQRVISAAIVDFALRDADATELCLQLARERVPFVLHSGFSDAAMACAPAAVIPKPACAERLVEAVGQLLGRH